MKISDYASTTAKLLGAGLFLITILVYTQSVTDPVNAPKLFVLGGISFGILGVFTQKSALIAVKKFRTPIIALGFFLLFSLSSLFHSTAPFTQSLYGVYGRNNGFLLYLCLVIVFLGALLLKEQSHFKLLMSALMAAGVVNVVYGVWTVLFGDVIGWSNPYGNLLGTLGNPNFAGSFFGMFSCVLFSRILEPSIKMRDKVVYICLIVVDFFCILQTDAIQGRVLFVVGFAITFFFFIRDKIRSRLIIIVYALSVILTSIIATLGALQVGPLTSFIYKTSVSLRGEYWYAGFKTGLSNPIFGVGFDGYGDWYRRSRRESALTLPGVDTVTNTAHNVYLDIFSFGGWPLFASYVFLNCLVLVSIVRISVKNRKFDLIFASLSSVWICYQLQSLISINQVGLSIWGWTLGGALLAYNHHLDQSGLAVSYGKGRIVQKNEAIISSWLRAGVLGLVGLITAVPPFASDSKWRQAQDSRDAQKLEQVLSKSYLNPINSFTLNNVVGVFETSNLPVLAHKYALEAVQFNPENFDSWKNLYLISQSSSEEKRLALDNMKRLDPFNPNLGK